MEQRGRLTVSENKSEYKVSTESLTGLAKCKQILKNLRNNKMFAIGITSIGVLMLVALVAPKDTFSNYSKAWVGDSTEAAIKRLERVIPGTSIVTVNPSPIAGLQEVITGEQVLYIAEDRYLVIGHIYDLKEARDLTQERKASVKLPSLGGARQPVAQEANTARPQPQERPLAYDVHQDAIPVSFEELSHLAVTYGPADAPKVYVFSDPQCGFCQRLHQELYGRNDIQVFELMFPMFPGSDVKGAQVLCATEDSKPDALTKVMNKQQIAFDEACVEQKLVELEASREFGRALNVTGTPTIFNEQGIGRAGYMPAQDLLNWLGGAN